MLRWDAPSGNKRWEELSAHARGGAGREASLGFKYHQGSRARGIGAEEEEVSPTLMTDSHAPAVCVQGTVANGKRMGQNGLGASEDACYTLDTMDAHGVCNAQNQRYEVGQSGDATTCGAIPAGQSGKQFDLVRLPATQYGEDMAGTLLARNDGSPCDNKGPNVVCVASTQANAERSDDCSPCLTSHLAKDPSVVCMADDNAHAAVDEGVCGTLKVGGRSLCCIPSSGKSCIGALCARESGTSSPEREGDRDER